MIGSSTKFPIAAKADAAPTAAIPGHKARLAVLDYLRGIAIILVLGRHIEFSQESLPAAVLPFFTLWERGGWIGVDLFFCLSGFLVSGLLFQSFKRNGSLEIKRFYIRRAFKIYPPFWVLIFFTAGKNWWAGSLNGQELASELLFVQNYFPRMCLHTWSLAVEEHFYLLLPLVLLAMVRWKAKEGLANRVGLVLLAPLFLCLALRLLNARTPYEDLTHVFATHLRVDSLFFGVFLSWLQHFHRDALVGFLRQWRFPLSLFGVAALLPCFLFNIATTPFIYTCGFTLNALGFGALLVLLINADAVFGRSLPLPGLRSIAWIGFYSYSIYLWHIPVRFLAKKALGSDYMNLSQIGVYLATSIILGVAMAKLIEQPTLKLRDRLCA